MLLFYIRVIDEEAEAHQAEVMWSRSQGAASSGTRLNAGWRCTMSLTHCQTFKLLEGSLTLIEFTLSTYCSRMQCGTETSGIPLSELPLLLSGGHSLHPSLPQPQRHQQRPGKQIELSLPQPTVTGSSPHLARRLDVQPTHHDGCFLPLPEQCNKQKVQIQFGLS